MKVLFQAVVLTLALAAAVSPVFSAGSQEAAKAQGPVTVTAMASVSDQIPPEVNPVLQEIRKQSGVNFTPLMIPSTEYQPKLNAMIAAGDLPDIIEVRGYQAIQYAENGVTIPLDDLIAKHGPDITANKKHLFTGNAVYNGKLYMVPTGITYGSNLSVRRDWLVNKGYTPPANWGPMNLTLDSYYKLLKDFTEGDPNKSGKKDTIGLGAAIAMPKTLYAAFGAYGIPYGLPVLVDGKVVPFYMHPQFIKAIEFYRRLYAEGLMESDFATIPNMSCFEKLWRGIYGVFDFQAVGTTNNWIGRYTEKPIPQFVFAVVSGPGGAHGWPKERLTQGFAVTSKSKNPAEAVKLLNYFHTEAGDMLIYHGILGVQYTIDAATKKVTYLDPFTDKAKHRNAGAWVYWRFGNRDKGAEIQSLTPQTQFGLDLYRQNQLEDAYIVGTPEIEKQYGQLFSDLAKEIVVNLITTKGDYVKEYEAYKAKYLASGGDKWIEQATAIYKRENNIK